MSTRPAIEVKNVSKNFVLPHEKANSIKSMVTGIFRKKSKDLEVQHALQNIDFTVSEGEFFGIVGRNGSGKSTLLKILAGIYQPSEGEVKTTGKLVPFIELGVGFNPELTGRENVYLNGAMLGFSEKEINTMYDDIVEFAELEGFMDKKLKNYSSGMQVRLAFSMATRAEASILLVDEVLAVGDADFQRKCFDYFKELKRMKKTVVFVSHDMNAVREYCDRALLIEANKMLKIGKTDDVAEHYTRLFTKEEESDDKSPVEKDQDRWGNGKAKTKNITVSVNPAEIVITHSIVAIKSVPTPLVGFRIRDAAGRDITGTNSLLEHAKTPDLQPNQIMEVEWRIPNILSDGSYFVDSAILQEDTVTVMEWWNNAKKFAIKKKRRLPYSIDPSFSIKVTASSGEKHSKKESHKKD